MQRVFCLLLCVFLFGSIDFVLAQEESHKATIAIGQVDVPKNVAASFNKDEFVARLQSALLATKRFDVLTRDKSQLSVLRDEQEFSASSFSSGNAAESGQLDAANYIISIKVMSYSFGRHASAVPNIDNKYFIRDSGSIGVELQVLDTTTGRITASFSLSDSFGTGQSVANSSRGGPAREHFVRMTESLGAQFATKLLETVFPTRVLQVVGDEIWINRGGESGISKDQEFVVYRPGEVLIDPYTKENLGTTESRIGKLKVVRINPKVSVGKIVDGDTITVAIGDIVRKQ